MHPHVAQFWHITVNVSLLLTVGIGTSSAFEQESVFEDEDIFKQALPPVPGAGGITVPGTKWCGPGNTAHNYTDLGSQRETDMCCRTHDHCEYIIEPGETIHELPNSGFFPILKCSCEQQFINCLQLVNTMVSQALGRVYFGTRGKCFGNGYPIRSCQEYQRGTFRKRCIRYEVDDKQPMLWQFYDMPFYTI